MSTTRPVTSVGEDPADEVLVAAFVGGDQEAFDRLTQRHRRSVYAICYRYFGNAADAEDAAQETFVTVFRRASTYNGAARFTTWLYRVAMNTCNDVARKRARRPQPATTAIEDVATEAEDLLGRRELALDLRAALSLLDDGQRTAVVLHDVLGWPYEDIAQRLGVAVGTVKSRIHRAHARLAAALPGPGDDSAEPDGTGPDREPRRLRRPPTFQRDESPT